jgi:energy-coupling factor transporter ATP-binding protein EcfA2
MSGAEAFGVSVRLLSRFYWDAIITSSLKNKNRAIMYGIMFACAIFAWLIFRSVWFMFWVIFLTATVVGLIDFYKDGARRKQQKFFTEIFMAMNFKASDDFYPYFIAKEEISEYATVYSFASCIPLERWFARKAEMEMYLNQKITDIQQDEEDNQIIGIFVQTAPLPEYIEWKDDYLIDTNFLSIGINYVDAVGMSLEEFPHAFVAGETGSGKSNVLKCMIYQSLVKNYDVVLIDFKRGVSFSDFSDHVEIYYEYPEVVKVLQEMVAETHSRLDKFREARVDNMRDYNNVSGDYLPRKMIFIDELAELLKTRDKQIANALNDSIETLTRIARAVGIHLIMGIQRPDSTVVSGQIKNNVSFRICGRFVDPEPSRIMLGNNMASSLLSIKGRFIIKADIFYEVQSFYFRGGNLLRRAEHSQAKRPQIEHKSKNLTTQGADKSIFADLFFEARKNYYSGEIQYEKYVEEVIIEQINPLLLAYQKGEIQFDNTRELALGMLNLMLIESDIEPSQRYFYDGRTFEQLQSDDEQLYTVQAVNAMREKADDGELNETPLLMTIIAALEPIMCSVGLGAAMGSRKEKLFKIYFSDEKLPLPLLKIWSVIAVHGDFDEELWDDYQIKLSDLKSKSGKSYTNYVATAFIPAPPPVPQPEPLPAPVPIQPKETATDSDSFEFDFSAFKK